MHRLPVGANKPGTRDSLKKGKRRATESLRVQTRRTNRRKEHQESDEDKSWTHQKRQHGEIKTNFIR